MIPVVLAIGDQIVEAYSRIGLVKPLQQKKQLSQLTKPLHCNGFVSCDNCFFLFPPFCGG